MENRHGILELRDNLDRLPTRWKAFITFWLIGSFCTIGGFVADVYPYDPFFPNLDHTNKTVNTPQSEQLSLTETVQAATPEDRVAENIASYFDPSVVFWLPKILEWSRLYGVDPYDTATIMQIESSGDPFALSPAGAIGLFQVMPFHFAEGENPFHPDTNAMRALTFFHSLLERSGGDRGRAYIGYNAGATRMWSPRDELPLETQRYWDWSGMSIEVTGAGTRNIIQAWYQAGGFSLANQARQSLEPFTANSS